MFNTPVAIRGRCNLARAAGCDSSPPTKRQAVAAVSQVSFGSPLPRASFGCKGYGISGTVGDTLLLFDRTLTFGPQLMFTNQHCGLPLPFRLSTVIEKGGSQIFLLKLTARVLGRTQRRIRGFRATGETRQVPEVSWKLVSKVPPTKNWRIWPTIFRAWPQFVYKNKTSNARGSISGLNRIFAGEIPQ